MEVSLHPDEGVVIVSLWHGSICRSTFRLPVEEAPALIEALSDLPGDAGPTDTHRGARGGRPESLLGMSRERLRRQVADIVTLERRPQR